MLSQFEHLLPEAVFDSVETLGGRCTGRFLPLNAMENRVYDVEMEEGPHLIIKFYRPGRWKKETIETEHEFLKKLELAEVPVVCPLSSANGETLFEKEGIYFAVFPKRPGRLEPELNKEQLERLGRYLARIHLVGDTFKNAPRGKLTPETYGTDSLKTLQKQNVLQGNLGNIFAQLVNEIVETSKPFFKDQEVTLLHGDCHAGNILWSGDEPYFIDFDDMLYAPPVQDFWMMIGGDDEYAMRNRDILIDAYLEIREFDERTWKLVEPLRALRMIYFNAWIANRKDDGAFKLAFPHFGTEQYWQQQVENLSNQLARLKSIST